MNDDIAVVALEADFNEVYHCDLRQLWVHNSGMTVRWVVDHFDHLPTTSRTKRHLIGEEASWSQQDHLMADVRDILLQNTYFTQITASKDIKQSGWSKIVDGIPKPPRRPGDEEPTPEFTPKDELVGLFGGGRKPRGRRK
jgi:hypothetical protein